MKKHSQLRAIVNDYIEEWRPRAEREFEVFRRLTDEEAIATAALAKLPSGKRHPHQYRIPRGALEESRRRLIDNIELLKRATTFDELIELVEQLSGSIHGIGQLTVYDTALRIGARLGLEPTRVYLHAGTRDGAKALLGCNGKVATLDVSELPTPLRNLRAREVEDLLCLYKDGLELSAFSCGPSLGSARRRICPTD
jgi:hypothetical protein